LYTVSLVIVEEGDKMMKGYGNSSTLTEGEVG
jgi:hypothetical protein